jgi:trehalose 6-phosphate synthase/phosphatase
MSCCSRMLGLEHVASRGSISIEYYGRNVGIKIMPTGVKPERYLNGFGWQDTIWRRGELLSQACPKSSACHPSNICCPEVACTG